MKNFETNETRILRAVQKRIRGKRALYVSNRKDPELESKLTGLLKVTITWCDGDMRGVQAQCERITNGKYDLVLSATGFQTHGTDKALSEASREAKVRYVRVNRGRPAACVQAIAREFGIEEGT